MSFILEAAKTGKDTILYNNKKYREKYSIKNGDIVWQCLGRTCKASITTNSEKTAIYSCNEKHSGSHPITMRSLTPTPPRRCADTPQPAPVGSPITSHSTATPVIDHVQEHTLDVHLTSPAVTDLHMENLALKKELAELSEKMQVVLDHSIEVDQRLLKYSDDVFMHPKPGSGSLQAPLSQPYTNKSIATQTEVPYSINTVCDSCRQPEGKHIAPSCLECNANKVLIKQQTDLVNSLQTTISVLEEDNKFLSNELSELRGRLSDFTSFYGPGESMLAVQNKVPITTSNSFASLEEPPVINCNDYKKPSLHRKVKTQTHKSFMDISALKQPTKCEARISVFGDSHSRKLLQCLSHKISERSIFVSVSPGAKLQNVLTNAHNMTSNFTRADVGVIIAGSNNIGECTAQNRRPAQVVPDLLKRFVGSHLHTRWILVPMFPRYDLPRNDVINNETRRVNKVIAEMARKMDVMVVDTDKLKRRHFTSHGLHLNMYGKRVLGEEIAHLLQNKGSTSQVSPVSCQLSRVSGRRIESLDDFPPLPKVDTPLSHETNTRKLKVGIVDPEADIVIHDPPASLRNDKLSSNYQPTMVSDCLNNCTSYLDCSMDEGSNVIRPFLD